MSTTPGPTGAVTKTRLIEAVAAELGVPRKEAERAVDGVLNVIARTLASGHNVNVTNFGTWISVLRPQRQAWNPQTFAPVTVPAQRKVRFRVSPRLADLVRAGDVAAVTISKHPKTPRTER